jgi:hypothetical protein
MATLGLVCKRAREDEERDEDAEKNLPNTKKEKKNERIRNNPFGKQTMLVD